MEILDKIYIINLESDSIRRERMLHLMGKYKLDKLATLYKALDTRSQRPPASFRGNGGAYGCTLSHLNVIREISQLNLTNVLIVEDDLFVHKKFTEYFQDFMKSIPPDYEVAYLGATQICWSGIEVNGKWYRAKNTLGTTAYIIRDKTVADTILQQWTGILPIDEFYTKLQDTHKFYVSYPNLLIQDVSDSHIRGNSWTMENVSTRLKWNLDDYDLDS